MSADPDFAELRTERLRLRRFRPDDATIFAAYRADPDVARYQAWDGYTLARARVFISEIATSSPGTPGAAFQFAVAELGSDRLLGDLYLRVEDDGARGELGFTFAREHQGQGYATEAVRGLIDYAFDRLELATIFAVPDARNTASIVLLERIGMRRVGTHRARFKGGWCDEHTYELERPG